MAEQQVAEVLRRAHGAVNGKDWAMAQAHAQLATQLEPANTEAWGLLADAYVGAGKIEQALAAIEHAVALSSDPGTQGFLYSHRGGLLFRLGRKDQAISSIREGLRLFPGHIDGIGMLIANEQFDLAKPLLDQARAGGVANKEEIDELEAHLIHDETLHKGFTPIQNDAGEIRWFALEKKAIDEVETAIRRLDNLGASSSKVAELTASLRDVRDEAMKRKYDGGFAVPIAAFVIGLIMFNIASSSRGDSSPYLFAFYYIAAAVAYVPACMAPIYKVNYRLYHGKTGSGGQYLKQVAGSGKGFVEGAMGAIMGFMCLGLFAPVVVLYHFVRNYLLK